MMACPEIILGYGNVSLAIPYGSARFRPLHSLIYPYCQFYANPRYSTIVESIRQINLFLQNKANSCEAKINVSSFVKVNKSNSTIL